MGDERDPKSERQAHSVLYLGDHDGEKCGDRVRELYKHDNDASKFWAARGIVAYGASSFPKDVRLIKHLLRTRTFTTMIVAVDDSEKFIMKNEWEAFGRAMKDEAAAFVHRGGIVIVLFQPVMLNSMFPPIPWEPTEREVRAFHCHEPNRSFVDEVFPSVKAAAAQKNPQLNRGLVFYEKSHTFKNVSDSEACFVGAKQGAQTEGEQATVHTGVAVWTPPGAKGKVLFCGQYGPIHSISHIVSDFVKKYAMPPEEMAKVEKWWDSADEEDDEPAPKRRKKDEGEDRADSDGKRFY
jgi:hypothetical protein